MNYSNISLNIYDPGTCQNQAPFTFCCKYQSQQQEEEKDFHVVLFSQRKANTKFQ